MGVEYEELRVLMVNKKTGEKVELRKQISHSLSKKGQTNNLYHWETKDFEYKKHQVIYG